MYKEFRHEESSITMECWGCEENCTEPVQVYYDKNDEPARTFIACPYPSVSHTATINIDLKAFKAELEKKNWRKIYNNC